MNILPLRKEDTEVIISDSAEFLIRTHLKNN
jgi:hypothetical protein